LHDYVKVNVGVEIRFPARERTACDEPDHPNVVPETSDGALQQLAMFWESVEAGQASVDHRSGPPGWCTSENVARTEEVVPEEIHEKC